MQVRNIQGIFCLPLTFYNVHSVTSNAVAEALSCSEQEIFTGSYWIDGKPIYKKVIDFGQLPNTTEKRVSSGLSDVTVISIRGFSYRITASGKKVVLPIPFISGSATGNISTFYTSTNEIAINVLSDRTEYSYTYMTLEYVKN